VINLQRQIKQLREEIKVKDEELDFMKSTYKGSEDLYL